MTDLPSLKERIETAEEGSRELDYAIFGATALKDRANHWAPADPFTYYTTSLDAALALVERVLPGSTYFIGKGRNQKDDPMYVVGFCRSPEKTFVEVEHDNLCLCILLALLTALTQDHGDENVG